MIIYRSSNTFGKKVHHAGHIMFVCAIERTFDVGFPAINVFLGETYISPKTDEDFAQLHKISIEDFLQDWKEVPNDKS